MRDYQKSYADLQQDLSFTQALSIIRAAEKQAPSSKVANLPLRIALLGQSTTSFLPKLLTAYLRKYQIQAQIYEAPFQVLTQEVLDTSSELYSFQPQAVILLVHEATVDFSAQTDPTESSDPKNDPTSQLLRHWKTIWSTITQHLAVPVIQSNYVIPAWDPLGNYALCCSTSRTSLLERLNSELVRQAPPLVHIFDCEALAGRIGKERFNEPTRWYAAGLSPAMDCLPALAHNLAALVAAAFGKSKKVLALDLDNTLWGGCVGETGAAGLEIGQTPIGKAYLDFQRYIKALHDRGILLVVLSKNEPENAQQPFLERPEMALSLSDFVYFAANWGDKPDNLQQCASALNLSIDSFVFVDDQPLERDLMRRSLPEVTVIELPNDPALYLRALHQALLFETWAISAEDRQRTTLYQQEQKRQSLQAQATDLKMFLQQLQMKLKVNILAGPHTALPPSSLTPPSDFSPQSWQRLEQLLAKTNQFNLTGLRLTSAQLQAPQMITFAADLSDSFGVQGLIGALVLKEISEDTLEICNWVLSCRVFKRGIEQGLFSILVKWAIMQGYSHLRAHYQPSTRNKIISHLLSELGFTPENQEYVYNLTAPIPAEPSWLCVTSCWSGAQKAQGAAGSCS